MKTINVVIVAFVMNSFALSQSMDTIPPTDSLIEYTGRIDFSNTASPRFSYPGISIRAAFTGTSISVMLNDDYGANYFYTILDGTALPKLKARAGLQTYVVCSNLTDTIHEIEVFRLTEQGFGKTSFNGFLVDSGKALTALTSKRTKMIEFIGNSITCGYGNEGVLGETFSASTENHYLSYAAITSRNFDARHLAVSTSGIGIYRNYNGPVNGNIDCMLNYYPRIFFYNENPKYDFKQKPDVICIDLGTNDFSTGGGDSARFVTAFMRFIDSLQSRYTDPDIVCLLGPMLYGVSLTNVRNYLQLIADSTNNRGRGNVHFFEMSQQTGDLGWGIDYHPTAQQHLRNGFELTNYISTLKGWNIVPWVMQADVISARHVQVSFNTGILDSTGDYGGFSVVSNRLSLGITSAYRDTSDAGILHLRLSNGAGVGDTVLISYGGGSIKGMGDTPLKSFRGYSASNNLIETSILSGVVLESGKEINLAYNKPLLAISALDGFGITGSRGSHSVDSFAQAGNRVTLYLHETVRQSDTVYLSYSGTSVIGQDEVAANSFENYLLTNGSQVTPVKEPAAELVHEFVLEQNYPNPFNPTTDVRYAISDMRHVSLKVYDVLGREVATLVNEMKQPGEYTVTWDATGQPSGIYYYRLTAETFSEMRKLMLMK